MPVLACLLTSVHLLRLLRIEELPAQVAIYSCTPWPRDRCNGSMPMRGEQSAPRYPQARVCASRFGAGQSNSGGHAELQAPWTRCPPTVAASLQGSPVSANAGRGPSSGTSSGQPRCSGRQSAHAREDCSSQTRRFAPRRSCHASLRVNKQATRRFQRIPSQTVEQLLRSLGPRFNDAHEALTDGTGLLPRHDEPDHQGSTAIAA